MSAPLWREGWQSNEQPEDAPARQVTANEQVDALLRRAGWDGRMDRDEALLVYIGQLQRQATRQRTSEQKRRYDAHFARAERGAGGRKAQEERKAATRANVEQAVVNCRTAYDRVNVKNCQLYWPKGIGRPSRATLHRHLKAMGYIQ